MPETASDLYFDTVTLSNFALVKRTDLLAKRYGKRLLIVPQVLDEVIDGIVAGYPALAAIETSLGDGVFSSAAVLSPAEYRTYRELLRTLSPGEAACIARAKSRQGIVVTDDRAARDCCTERDVRFTGTIGILKACCRDGTLQPDEADAILQAMTDAGYHSPVRRVSDLL